MFFTNRHIWKYIPDLDLVKGVRPVDVLIELRGVKDFDAFPFTSERVEIAGHHSYWRPTWTKGHHSRTCSVRDLCHLAYFYD
jgi:hypothetical protein